MTLVVPFDDSALARAALVRARQFDTALEEGVVAVTVVPGGNAEYARQRGWIDATEPFDLDRIVERLEESVAELAPESGFECIVTDRRARHGTIAKKLRRFARDAEATIIFIGSENAGRLTSSISVGSSVTTDRHYDTMIISTPKLPEIPAFEEVVPSEETLEGE